MEASLLKSGLTFIGQLSWIALDLHSVGSDSTHPVDHARARNLSRTIDTIEYEFDVKSEPHADFQDTIDLCNDLELPEFSSKKTTADVTFLRSSSRRSQFDVSRRPAS